MMVCSSRRKTSYRLTWFLFSSILLAVNAEPFHLRRPSRRLEGDTESQYSILLHLSMQYVNDTVAQLLQPTGEGAIQNGAVRHLCNSINEQAGGNQVASTADENGVNTVETEIGGTINDPDYQCEVVYAGRIDDSVPDATLPGASQLFSFGVTVAQLVYVTANRTVSLEKITSIVQSGFNRGKGGRVRFRSLLRNHPIFATVDNVEVFDGVLTRYPTQSPTKSPSKMPSQLPSWSPTHGPTPTLKSNTSFPSKTPTPAPVILTAKPILPFNLRPTDKPSNDDIPSVASAMNDEDSKSSLGALDPLTVAAIIGGTIMILIASLCVVYLWCSAIRRREAKEGKQDKNARTEGRTNKAKPSNEAKTNEGSVPNMVQLDDDNRSLANTTLGDQTAGGRRREKKPPSHKPEVTVSGSDRIRDSFDDASLYTGQVAAVSSTGLTDTSKHGIDSNHFSSSSDSAMLPPSVMPYEEESIMFPVEMAHSDSTSTGSVDPESSLLSESFASSSLVGSDADQGPVDLDALENSAHKKKSFRTNPFPDRHSEELKEHNDTKGKASLQRKSSGGREAPSRFSPFDTHDTLKSVKLDFDKQSRINSSFLSLEDDVAPSVASSTSSLTKKAENLLFFGFQPPPEEEKIQNSPVSSEEEKREIECETRDEAPLGSLAGTGREGGRTPLPVDLLADHQLLERSPSPASWSSWRVSQERPSRRDAKQNTRRTGEAKSSSSLTSNGGGQTTFTTSRLSNFLPFSNNAVNVPESTNKEVRANNREEDNFQLVDTTTSPAPALPGPSAEAKTHAKKLPQEHNTLGNGPSAFTTAGLRSFLPFSDGETKESSSDGLNESDLTTDREEEDKPPRIEKKALGAALLGLHSKAQAQEAQAVDVHSGSSSSTGQNNPWLFEAVEQALGPRSVTADLESLSGRSNRSGKSYRSTRSRQSHRSHKSTRSHQTTRSSRSYNVPPSGKYKGRGEGRVRSAAASVASYAGSSTERKSADTKLHPRNLETDLKRLEQNRLGRQLAALQTETDQITASSITLSSVGAKTRSTRSSKLTHTGAKIIRKRRVIVEVPPGKLGVVLANRHDGKGTVVSEVRPDSTLKGMLSPGDKLVAIDGEDVRGFTVNEITEIMTKRHDMERLLTVITSTHQETKSVATEISEASKLQSIA